MEKIDQQLSFHSESEYAAYYKHSNKNIAIVRFKENQVISLKRAKEIVDTMDGIMDTTKDCYSIVQVDFGSFLSKRARNYFAKADTYKSYKKAIAVVIKELPQRIVYNFYISFNKPYIKHKSFNSVKKALTWLSNQEALNRN